MSDLRKAAQQALEAMEYAGMDVGKFNRVNAACTALRAALAQEQSDLRKAAQDVVTVWKMYGTVKSLRGWMGILEAVLAQQAGSWQDGLLEGQLRERERWLAQDQAETEPACKCSLRTRLAGDGCEVCNPKLAAELRQQPEPVQEPVEWWKRHGDGSVELNEARTVIAEDAIATGRRPLIFGDAAPPQRPPLTEEEIDKAVAQERDALLDHIYEYGTLAEGVLERIRKLCRAIERKMRGE
jgi:hypothetical protein